MTESIYVFRDGGLSLLKARPYETEAILQDLLARFPELLGAVGEANGLLLIKREKTVPGEKGGGARWSLDHLFVDQQGVPVLVEVKRASDSRARREVVAQMLDYAANGVAYWPVSEFIEEFELSCQAEEVSPDERLSQFLEDNIGAEDFWRRVEANLKAGRIRMVFVADVIADELRRIVEFLNEQMRPAEVLALEVAHFTDNSGTRTLVPKVIGETARAVSNKAPTRRKLPPISIDEWIDELAGTYGAAHGEVARRLVAWADECGFETGPSNTQDSLFISPRTKDGKRAWPLFIRRSGGRLEVHFQNLMSRPSLAELAVRQHFLDEILAIDGIETTTDNPSGVPAIPLDRLVDGDVMNAFLLVAARLCEEAMRA